MRHPDLEVGDRRVARGIADAEPHRVDATRRTARALGSQEELLVPDDDVRSGRAVAPAGERLVIALANDFTFAAEASDEHRRRNRRQRERRRAAGLPELPPVPPPRPPGAASGVRVALRVPWDAVVAREALSGAELPAGPGGEAGVVEVEVPPFEVASVVEVTPGAQGSAPRSGSSSARSTATVPVRYA